MNVIFTYDDKLSVLINGEVYDAPEKILDSINSDYFDLQRAVKDLSNKLQVSNDALAIAKSGMVDLKEARMKLDIISKVVGDSGL